MVAKLAAHHDAIIQKAFHTAIFVTTVRDSRRTELRQTLTQVLFYPIILILTLTISQHEYSCILMNKIELISNQIPHINESIIDHHAIINKLEHQISLITEKLSSLHNINKSSVPVPSSTELSVNYIHSDLLSAVFEAQLIWSTVRHLLFAPLLSAVFGTKI